jgi:hypothetical protein
VESVVRLVQFLLVLRPESGVDGMLAIRRALKFAGRACGLKCVSVRRDPVVLEPPNQSGIADVSSAHAEEMGIAQNDANSRHAAGAERGNQRPRATN